MILYSDEKTVPKVAYTEKKSDGKLREDRSLPIKGDEVTDTIV